MLNSFRASLQTLLEKIEKDFHLFPFMGAELEFYFQSPLPDVAIFIGNFIDFAQTQGLFLYGFTSEKGENQYEIALHPTKDINFLAYSILHAKELLRIFAHAQNNCVSFESKPYINQPPNALHFHIHIEDEHGNNMCVKPNPSSESEITYKILGGLLEAMPESMIYFSPSPDSYKRYNSSQEETPRFVCWGGNNRTAALRLPETTHAPSSRRIEHRIASSDACPYQVLTSLLAAIHYGLENNIFPGEKIYGNTYDMHYQEKPYALRRLPTSLEEAKECAQQGKILRRYILCFSDSI